MPGSPVRGSGIRSAMLPRLVPRQIVEEVLAEVFELRPDCSEVEELCSVEIMF